ncbi:cation/H(+) antiporter 15-like [Prosopis cineraria]|uniref:cation/H(+) antiporter 15-like n=1 Tax=Prosopis cineraria TaxID=364024 RepID=UPI00240EACCA|nr:cation/H(+) antiporter 15-like [Prosopis cineraria]
MAQLIPNPCYVVEVSNPNEIWKTDYDILNKHAPLLGIQITFCIFITNLFHTILKPLHQPRIVAQILAGFFLSLVIAVDDNLVDIFLPARGILNLETYTNFGIMGYVFLSGLEMNLDTILQVGKNDAGIALLGMIIPTAMGIGLFALIQKVYEMPPNWSFQEDDMYMRKAYLFWCLALPISSFPLLARILTDLKLLYTKLGKATLRAALFSETYGWVLFIALIPFSRDVAAEAILSVLSTMMFILFCIFVLRPFITKYIDQNTHPDKQNNSALAFLLLGAFVCSYVTDFLGTHPAVGSFVYGLILPNGRFTDLVMGTLDNFVSGAISPFFFFRIGLNVNLMELAHQKYWPLMVVVILLLSIPKVLSTLIATFFFELPTQDSIGMGLLLNSKGALALIILNLALDRKIFSVVLYTIMVFAVLVMNIMAPLFINFMYKPRKKFENFKLRTIEMLKNHAELRILSCVHNIHQATCMANLLKTFNANRISPLRVFGVHLVELIGRAVVATTLLVDQMEQPTHSGSPDSIQSQPKLKSITNTFNTLQEENNAIRVENLHAMSAYETIYEDIHNLAEQNRTSLILLPFQKQNGVIGGRTEATDEAYKDINLKVIQHAPCSVALLVDRGLGSISKTNLRIVMLFVGGPDDREALAVAWRMVGIGNLGNTLSVVRIVLVSEAAEAGISTRNDDTQWPSSTRVDDERQQALDEEYMDSFRFKAVYNNESVTYSEEEVHNGEELIALLQELDKVECDLCISGQGNGRNTIVFSSFMEWCDNPELGVIGDIVASNSSLSSLLVVKQYGHEEMVFGRQNQHTRTGVSNEAHIV